MTDMKNLSAHLLKRYFEGDCTKAEKALVENWLNADPENADKAFLGLEPLPGTEESLPAELLAAKEEVWEKTIRQVQHTGSKGRVGAPVLWGQHRPGQRRSKLKKACLQVAAGLSGLIMIGFAGQAYLNNQTTVKTAYGKVQRLTLPDSTVVYLNGNSELTYGSFLSGKSREVWLEGEAFFEVRHLEDHQKFMVHLSDQVEIEVLGTEFNVSNRKPGNAIVLKSGKIKINLRDDQKEKNIYLKPGDLVTTGNQATAGIHKKTVDPEVYYAWIAHKWVLDDTSLGEMLLKLEETYGIKTVVTDKALLEKRASGSIPLPEDDTAALMGDIANLFELSIQKKGDILYLKATQVNLMHEKLILPGARAQASLLS
jgi:ferric-dicitrate binding protein FerR (iron transport regulator)